MTITIRRGSPPDAADLAELGTRTFRETFSPYTPPADMALHLSRAYGTEKQGEELADPAVVTLLAEVDGRLAGFAQLRAGATPDCVTGESPIELWRLYVDRPWHGRRVASALMEEVEREARERGARTLWLGVWEGNERAKAFYRKYGFTDVGSHVFLLGSDVQRDHIWMRTLSVEIPSGET